LIPIQKKALLECLLFVAGDPVPVATLSTVSGISPEEIKELLDALARSYEQRQSGLQIREVAGGYQFCTRPEYASYLAKLYPPRTVNFSRAALETLAVIAYRQPVTRLDIEMVRGVKADGVLATLLERGLITEVGRREGPGRPILYGTTAEFLRYFGLKALQDLPDLETFMNKETAAGSLGE
jgi:segregation and condensation protein B